jgi:hypothetical protein
MNLYGGMVEYRVVSCIGQIIIVTDTAGNNLTLLSLQHGNLIIFALDIASRLQQRSHVDTQPRYFR